MQGAPCDAISIASSWRYIIGRGLGTKDSSDNSLTQMLGRSDPHYSRVGRIFRELFPTTQFLSRQQLLLPLLQFVMQQCETHNAVYQYSIEPETFNIHALISSISLGEPSRMQSARYQIWKARWCHKIKCRRGSILRRKSLISKNNRQQYIYTYLYIFFP